MVPDPDAHGPWDALLPGALAAVVAGLGLGAAAALLPVAALEQDPIALVAAGAAWWLAGTALAAPLAALAGWWPRGALPAAAAWVLASVAVAVSGLGWSLSPTRSEYLRTGPALGVWLLAALPLLGAAGSGRPSPGAVWTRAVVVWGAGYAGLWVGLAPTQLPVAQGVPPPVKVALVIATAAAWAGAAAVAGAWTGPLRPREQLASLVLAHPLLVAIGPDVARTVRRGSVDTEQVFVLGAVASVPFAGVVAGGLAAWLRARRRDRAAAGPG